jgi:uncharacterized membrane protein
MVFDIIKNYKKRRDIIDPGINKVKRSSIKIVRDRPLKSILKAITWRMVGTADTIIISYLLTGKAIIAFSIGSIEVFTKMFLYFIHERLWEQLRWGRMMVHIRRNRRIAKKRFNRLIFKSA